MCDVEREKRLTDDFSPAIDQLALAEFLRRRDRVLTALTRHLPELEVTGIAAGVHLLLRLPRHADDARLSVQALEAGIRVPPLSSFCPGAPTFAASSSATAGSTSQPSTTRSALSCERSVRIWTPEQRQAG